MKQQTEVNTNSYSFLLLETNTPLRRRGQATPRYELRRSRLRLLGLAGALRAVYFTCKVSCPVWATA